jgi:hypothetical protein
MKPLGGFYPMVLGIAFPVEPKGDRVGGFTPHADYSSIRAYTQQ